MTEDKSASREFLLNTEDFSRTQSDYDYRRWSNEDEHLARTRRRQLCRLWWQRYQREVAPELLPFLDDASITTREDVIRALGRLETSLAELPLETRIEGITTYLATRNEYNWRRLDVATKGRLMRDEPPPNQNLFLKGPLVLALARIRSRSFQTEEKLEAFSQALGLEFTELVHLVQELGEQQGKFQLISRVIDEVVDIFHVMGRQGLDIQTMGVDIFARTPVAKVKIQTARLTPQDAIELMLDYLFSPRSDNAIASPLLDFGQPAVDALVERVQEMQSDHSRFLQLSAQVANFGGIFRVSACTGDKRFVPLLERFSEHPDGNARYYAAQALAQMRAHEIPLRFP